MAKGKNFTGMGVLRFTTWPLFSWVPANPVQTTDWYVFAKPNHEKFLHMNEDQGNEGYPDPNDDEKWNHTWTLEKGKLHFGKKSSCEPTARGYEETMARARAAGRSEPTDEDALDLDTPHWVETVIYRKGIKTFSISWPSLSVREL